MKVVLVGLPTRNIGNKFPNIGVLTIAQYVRSQGHDVHVIDVVRYGYSVDDVLIKLKSLNPDIIGLSGIITSYYYFEPLAIKLKELLPNTPVVVGGGITCVIDMIEKYTEIDYAIKGEGEHVMLSLISLLEANHNVQDYDIAGLYVRKGHIFKHPSIEQEYPDLSNSLYPAYEFYDMDYYISSTTQNTYRFLKLYPEVREKVGEGVNFFSVAITRGCPYKCSFCFRFVKKFRHPTTANAVGHLKMIKEKYNCSGINLLDELAIVDKKWFIEFCETLSKEVPDLKIFAGVGRANLLSDEIIYSAKKAGFIRIGCGIESGSQKILDLLNKKTTVEQNRSAVQRVKASGMMATCNFIFGTPGENRETLKETEKFIADNLDPRDYAINLATAYPGTPLFDHAVEKGILKKETIHNYILDATFGNYPLNFSEFKSTARLIREVDLMQFRLMLNTLLKERATKDLIKLIYRRVRNEIIYLLSIIMPQIIPRMKKYYVDRRFLKIQKKLVGENRTQ